MSTQPNPAPKTTFGPFEYDGRSGELRKFGTRIRLQSKPLQILEILLDRPGEAISRDELRRHLWQETTFVDFEQGLNTAVNKLRQALGDSADQPRFVETLPGKGYRFIAPVQFGSPKTVLEIAPPSPRTEEARPAKLRNWLPWTACAAALASAVVVYALARRPEPATPLKMTRFTVAPPSGFAFEAGASRQSFALSPDGARVAFTAMDSSGAFSTFLRDFDELESRLIPETAGSHTLFWPPDGGSLFLTGKGKLRRVSITGGAHVVLTDSPSFTFAGTWVSPEKLLLSTIHGSYLAPTSGGSLDSARTWRRWPQLMPDGKHILYVERDVQRRRFNARVARLDDSGAGRLLLESDSRVMYTASAVTPGTGYLMYVRAGNLVARPFDPRSLEAIGEVIPVAAKIYSFPTGSADFSVSAKGTIAYHGYASRSQLAWVDRGGRQVGTIGPPNVNVKSGRLSSDGQKLAAAIYDVERGAQDLWIFDVKTNTGRLLSSDPGVRDAPVWSPDSRSLSFLYGSGGGPPQVHVRGLGEKDAEIEVVANGFQMPTDWSPDGRFIAFANTGIPRIANEIQGDVWLVDMANGRQSRSLLNTQFHEGNAAFSPDGKWLAFTSNESGRPEVYLQAFDSKDGPRVFGERRLVSQSGAQALRWRRDGTELFYLGLDGRVWVVPVKLSAQPTFGEPKPLFTISTEARAAVHSITGFDVSSDGQRFVVPVVSSDPGPSLVIVKDWEALLRSSR